MNLKRDNLRVGMRLTFVGEDSSFFTKDQEYKIMNKDDIISFIDNQNHSYTWSIPYLCDCGKWKLNMKYETKLWKAMNS